METGISFQELKHYTEARDPAEVGCIGSDPKRWRSDPAIRRPQRSKESAICEGSRSDPFGSPRAPKTLTESPPQVLGFSMEERLGFSVQK